VTEQQKTLILVKEHSPLSRENMAFLAYFWIHLPASGALK